MGPGTGKNIEVDFFLQRIELQFEIPDAKLPGWIVGLEEMGSEHRDDPEMWPAEGSRGKGRDVDPPAYEK